MLVCTNGITARAYRIRLATKMQMCNRLLKFVATAEMNHRFATLICGSHSQVFGFRFSDPETFASIVIFPFFICAMDLAEARYCQLIS